MLSHLAGIKSFRRAAHSTPVRIEAHSRASKSATAPRNLQNWRYRVAILLDSGAIVEPARHEEFNCFRDLTSGSPHFLFSDFLAHAQRREQDRSC
jgi:hypothetical protein